VFVAAAAPPRLLARTESVSVEHGRGVVAQLTDGPVIIFGRPFELVRKWRAAAAVLAQRSSQGATFIDVRMPDRPVAGGLGVQLDPQPQAEALAAGADPTVPSGTSTSQPAAATAGTAPAGTTAGVTQQAAPQGQSAGPEPQSATATPQATDPAATGTPAATGEPSTTTTQAQP
jgi:hypothetical protein